MPDDPDLPPDAPASHPPDAPVRRGRVTARGLNLRVTPDTAQPPLTVLPRGTALAIDAVVGRWYAVRTPLGDGFVHGDFVALDSPIDDPASPDAGFLHERPALREVPLPAPDARRLMADPARSTPTTRRLASTWNALGGLLLPICDRLWLDPSLALVVLVVESSGRGFGADGRLTIRVEVHKFWSHWGIDHADVFDRHFRFDASRRWQGHRVRDGEHAPWETFHGRQAGEWRAFDLARTLDEDAALRAISMGMPQIMGFNHPKIGYGSPQAMFARFTADVRWHALGLFDFITGPGQASTMLDDLRRGQFEAFATAYNGQGQAVRYADRLAQHRDAFATLRPAPAGDA
ncbi:MAG: N-acetylmuramidase domain-containing protein [Acidobacteriota bacterium]